MGASAAAAFAQDAPTDDVTTSVVPTEGWTATGVMVRTGTDVAIRASGSIHFGQPPIDRMAPTGRPWGPQCEAVAGPSAQWVAPGLDCYALIGRVGSGPTFVIGNGATVDAAADGELMLTARRQLRRQRRRVVGCGQHSEAIRRPTPKAGTPNQGAVWRWLRSSCFRSSQSRPHGCGGAPPANPPRPPQTPAARIDVRIAHRTPGGSTVGGGASVRRACTRLHTDRAGWPQHSFAWRDVEFRAVRSRFACPHGEVVLRGEDVAAPPA
jgi:hypothetical protein